MQRQLFKFKQSIPSWLELLLDSPDTVLAKGCSGGKDSQALISHIQKQNYRCQVIVVHADVGERVEWPGTKTFVEGLGDRANLELAIVRRKVKGKYQDLYDYIEERRYKREGGIFWPSSQARYCTSTFKTGQLINSCDSLKQLSMLRELEL